VICTVLSHDLDNDPDVVRMNRGPPRPLTFPAFRLWSECCLQAFGFEDGEYVLNPDLSDDMHELRKEPRPAFLDRCSCWHQKTPS